MLDIENIDKMIEHLKEIKKQIKKRNKIRRKLVDEGGNMTPKRQQQYIRDLLYINKHIEGLEHNIHCIAVDYYIAEPFKMEYYGDKLFYPDENIEEEKNLTWDELVEIAVEEYGFKHDTEKDYFYFPKDGEVDYYKCVKFYKDNRIWFNNTYFPTNVEYYQMLQIIRDISDEINNNNEDNNNK